MTTPNQPDRTGATQPIDQIVAILQSATPEKRTAILAAIDKSTAPIRQQLAVAVAPTVAPKVIPAPVPEPLSEQQKKTLKQELLDHTTKQYDEGYEAWKSTFQLSAKDLMNLAKKDDVMKWAATVQAETINGLKQYGEPRLKLLSDMPTSKLIDIINAHPMIPGQNKSVIWWDQWNKVAAKSGSFGLTTDIEDMPFDPKIYYINGVDDKNGTRKNEAMVGLYGEKFRGEGLDLMPQEACVSSVADALAQGKVLDRKFYTAFKRPQGAGSLPRAYWRAGHVAVGGYDPDDSSDALRGRVWVSGEKKN